ncbi:hypothetical protein HPB52_004631 [Rhipicephalus sanguineus]|uniref:Ribosome biogenesis protein BRX1 homolog n=1 Tax=Rhipicephalus sanguineus TaxID=34632 RepID=A0A9D4PBF2_RHISA|nr:hypothetical protein HPB52_004631 [Rhipicephalus sanguineus]
MARRNKRARVDEDAENAVETQERLPPVTRKSDEPPEKKVENLTILHLMLNLRTLLPHSKPESKMEKKDPLVVINEVVLFQICEMKNCNKCLYFENKKRKDLYLWASNVPNGPSVKFLVENIHTMEELKMTGNCLKGARPLLSFDKAFTESPFGKLMKELLSQVFGTPRYHPKSQPFVDHVFTFSLLDHRIWFRNYQIVEETGALVEIGPRFVLNPIKVFEGSFGGAVIYSNPHYVTPSEHRRSLKLAAAGKYKERKEARANLKHRMAEGPAPSNPLDDIFQTVPPEKAKGRDKLLFRRKK